MSISDRCRVPEKSGGSGASASKEEADALQ